MSDDLGSITSALFRSYDPGDPGFTVRARAFAICLGGAGRMRGALLNCRSQMPQGIGNDHDLVGRFFCDRPTVVHLRPPTWQSPMGHGAGILRTDACLCHGGGAGRTS